MTKGQILKLTCLTNGNETITLGLLTIDSFENAMKRRVRKPPHVQRIPVAEKEA